MLERLIEILQVRDPDERSRRIDELAYEAMSYAARQRLEGLGERMAESKRLHEATLARTRNWPAEILTTSVGRWWL